MSGEPPPLFAAERPLVAKAVPARQREFAWSRACARRALRVLGHVPDAILAGPDREPLWPDGYVGSISHSGGYVVAVAAERRRFCSVGIDAEVLNSQLTPAVVSVFAAEEELEWLADQPISTSLLIFSAKESFYKAWFPLTGSWLEFRDVKVSLLAGSSRFRVTLGDAVREMAPRHWNSMIGHHAWGVGRVLTSVVVPAPAELAV